MHGRFTENLREFAHDYAKKLKFQFEEEQEREKEEDDFRSFSGGSAFAWNAKCMFLLNSMSIHSHVCFSYQDTKTFDKFELKNDAKNGKCKITLQALCTLISQ